ncbi:MAG: hypothetical protein IJT87_04735 [Ruminiclostridium sp.]|nr:hypothetical protein [Ruminiclostridium sp.]
MNELDILIRAEKYISDLANGKDPLTGTELGDEQIVNNVRISRCLFYVSGVLKKVIDNGGEVNTAPAAKPKRSELVDFALTDEQALALKPESYDVSLSRIVTYINANVDENVMKKVRSATVAKWLMERGLLTEVERGGKIKKIPTPEGEQIGMTEKLMTNRMGMSYNGVSYEPGAQQFIFDNIDSIIALAAEEEAEKAAEKADKKAEKEEQKARMTANAGKPWSREDDEKLAEMYRNGSKMKEMQMEFGRTRGSIDARLAKLGFDVRNAYKRNGSDAVDESYIPPDFEYNENYTPDNFDDIPLPSEPGNFGLDESSPYFGNAAIPNEQVD